MIQGRDYRDYPLERGLLAVEYGGNYEAQQARLLVGLTLAEYEALPGTPLWMQPGDVWSKSHVLAYFRIHTYLEAANQSAQVRNSRRGAMSRGHQ